MSANTSCTTCCCSALFPPVRRRRSKDRPEGGTDTVDFYDAEEGGSQYDYLFERLQASRLFVHQLQRRISSQLTGQRGSGVGSRMSSFCSLVPPAAPTPDQGWLGTTLPERGTPQGGRPVPETSGSWSRGNGLGFKVRGSFHSGRVAKVDSTGALYECVSADIVQADCKVGEVLGRLAQVPTASSAERSARGTPTWSRGCPLPRILCTVAQLPPQTSSDEGCSIVTVHHIKPETLSLLQSPQWPAGLRMFVDFVRAGRTDREDGQYGSATSGLVKAVAFVDNVQEVGVPLLLRAVVESYNGKPCLITRSGTVFKDPTGTGEWLELDIDVRCFSKLARTMLYKLGDFLPRAVVHCGFTIQGCEEEELPEGIVCDLWLHNINLVEDPRRIDA